MQSNQRLKIVQISGELAASTGINIREFICILLALPRDADFIAAHFKFDKNVTEFLFRSNEFPEVPLNESPPYLHVEITYQIVDRMRNLISAMDNPPRQPTASVETYVPKVRPLCNCGMEDLVYDVKIHDKRCASLKRD